MRIFAIAVLTGVISMAVSPVGPTSSNSNCGCEGETLKAQVPKSVAEYELHGAVEHVHDPAIAKEGKNYYIFSTGPGIPIRISKDRVNWLPPIRLFEKVPAWTRETIPGSNEFYWAPDISYFNHRWHVYYAVSTFGRNRSAIGLATNETLDSAKPNYKWTDEGVVFQSYATDNFNAIDPNIVLDSKGTPWLSFGSFWSGIKVLKLDPLTGKPQKPSQVPDGIASRPHTKDQPGAIEAPFIVKRGRFFYLFVSFDFCCRGVRSTYNIRVGRSNLPEGPYVDRNGIKMTDGGGTLVLESEGRWHGPGGNAYLRDGRKDLLVFHAYDGNDNGVPKLQVRTLNWDKQGWPIVSTP